MIDCHCHLCSNEFAADIDIVIANAQLAKVRCCLVNTETVVEFDDCLQLNRKYPTFALPYFGVHPVQYESGVARSVTIGDLNGCEQMMRKHADQLVAVGEVGLDFTPRYLKDVEADKEQQRDVFRKQIQWAIELDLPLICHSRSAGRPVIDFLLENGAKNVLLHAFSGNFKSAKAGIEAGYCFSVPPSVVRSDQKQNLFDKIPVEQLLLETDSPVLGPRADERNEPRNVSYSAEFIAKVKQMSLEEVIEKTTTNALRLFPKLKLYLK